MCTVEVFMWFENLFQFWNINNKESLSDSPFTTHPFTQTNDFSPNFPIHDDWMFERHHSSFEMNTGIDLNQMNGGYDPCNNFNDPFASDMSIDVGHFDSGFDNSEF